MISVEKAQLEDLEEMAEIYKESFKVHNIFDRPKEEVIEYLKKMINDLLIAKIDGDIAGGLCLNLHHITEGHMLFNIRHVAVKKDKQGEGVGSALMEKASVLIQDMMRQNNVKSAKIEVNVAESEKDAIQFYDKHGFEIEGRLKSHYRSGEECFILGKIIE